MRRIDRRHLDRWRRRAAVIGSSFAFGALVATTLIARMHRIDDVQAVDSTIEAAPVATTGKSLRAVIPRALAIEAVPPAVESPSAPGPLDLMIPVDGVTREQLRDTFKSARGGGRSHDAIDIMAPRGTDVRAAADGTIEKLFTSKPGGLTIYEFDSTRTFSYYYAHLDGYASGVREHQAVTRGQLIGYVGSTGNASADAPHLHFAIARLGPGRQWWKGESIDPYPLLAP